MESPRTQPEPRRLIGDKYRIRRLLGMGRTSAVFEAYHVVTDIPVALKWMLVGPDESAERARFHRQVSVDMDLSHPHVAAVHDWGEESGSLYSVMSYLRGETLRAALTRGALTRPQRVEVVVQCLGALAYSHRFGVVHCDVKSSNIMLCRSEEPDVPYVQFFDFGKQCSWELRRLAVHR